MTVMKRLSRDEMTAYFEQFNKRFLNLESTDVADVEVLGQDIGDQVAAEGVHLDGITFDPQTATLELELEGGDVRSRRPREVWVDEENDGFIRALVIVREDGAREIIRVRRLGVQPAD